MVFNPALYLDHGILGAFVLILVMGIGLGFKLINRLIDTLHHGLKEQVSALMSVEKAVHESIDKAERRHHETVGTFLRYTELMAETRDLLKKWSNGALTRSDE